MKESFFKLRYHVLTLLLITYYLMPSLVFSDKVISQPEYSEIQVIDTFTQYLEKDLSSDFYMSGYAIGYIGPKVNTINNDVFYNYNEFNNSQNPKFSNGEARDFKIFVDTSRIIGKTKAYTVPPPPPLFGEKIKPSKLYEREQKTRMMSYPVFIENLSKDTLQLEGSFHLNMVLEAIDSCGNWRPIQSPLRYKCGNGLPYLFLPNGEIAFTSVLVTHGNYRTQQRLRYRHEDSAYSNVFYGNIDYSQFEQGNYIRRTY